MNKKFIAPIVIGIIVSLYSAYMLLLIANDVGSGIEFIFISIFIIFTILGMVHVVKERIREIKVGEDNDISKY